MKRLEAVIPVLAMALGLLAPPSSRAEEASVRCPGGVALTAISAIQGSGASSPLTGRMATTEGVVTGDFQPAELQSGFFIQSEHGDDNPATSEGLFIYVPQSNPLSRIDVRPGDRVRVSGTVTEYRTGNGTLTEFSSVSALTVCSSGPGLAPTPVSLPVEAVSALESYEGMLVTFPQVLTVTGTPEPGPVWRAAALQRRAPLQPHEWPGRLRAGVPAAANPPR